MGESRPTWSNHPPTPGISPKIHNFQYFLTTKPQLYISQDVRKLSYSNVEFQKKNFADTQTSPQGQEGTRRERGGGNGKGYGEGRHGEGQAAEENRDCPPTSFGLKFALKCLLHYYQHNILHRSHWKNAPATFHNKMYQRSNHCRRIRYTSSTTSSIMLTTTLTSAG